VRAAFGGKKRASAILPLDPAYQYQDHHNQQDKADPTARAVAPPAAVIPSGKGTQQQQDQYDNEDGSKHRPFFWLNAACRRKAMFVIASRPWTLCHQTRNRAQQVVRVPVFRIEPVADGTWRHSLSIKVVAHGDD